MFFNNLPLKKIQLHFGLTLMETTIALGILMIGVLASITVMLSSFNFAQETEQEIIVVNLAREGIEIMRAIRDNEDDNNPDDVDLFDGSYDNKNFYVDSNDGNSAAAMNARLVTTADNANDCDECKLYFKDGQYLHDATGNDTIFNRMISLKPGSSNSEKIIISEVGWTLKGKTHSYLLEAHLTDWQD